MRELGRHLIFEFSGCDGVLLNDSKRIEEVLVKAAEKSGMKVVGKASHKFGSQGVTSVIILAESHIVVHTWPEYGYVAIDIFVCGSAAQPMRAYEEVLRAFSPKSVSALEVKRGLIRA
jgi:S-adenosylmethionine decarboxylase proenzyme